MPLGLGNLITKGRDFFLRSRKHLALNFHIHVLVPCFLLHVSSTVMRNHQNCSISMRINCSFQPLTVLARVRRHPKTNSSNQKECICIKNKSREVQRDSQNSSISVLSRRVCIQLRCGIKALLYVGSRRDSLPR